VWSPNTGIVDWALVTENYGKDFEELGGTVFKNFSVTGFKEANESSKAGDDNRHGIRIFGEGGKVG
jgi:L-2-hydroxyglutarate oxidase LhgO